MGLLVFLVAAASFVLLSWYGALFTEKDASLERTSDRAVIEEAKRFSKAVGETYRKNYYLIHLSNYGFHKRGEDAERFFAKAILDDGKVCDVLYDERFRPSALESCSSGKYQNFPASTIFSLKPPPTGILSKRIVTVLNGVGYARSPSGAGIPYLKTAVSVAVKTGRDRYNLVRVYDTSIEKSVLNMMKFAESELDEIGNEDLRYAEEIYRSKEGNPFVFEWALSRLPCVDSDGNPSYGYYVLRGSLEYGPSTWFGIAYPNSRRFAPSEGVETDDGTVDDPSAGIYADEVYDANTGKGYPLDLFYESNTTVLANAGILGSVLERYKRYPPNRTRSWFVRYVTEGNTATEMNGAYGDVYNETLQKGHFCLGWEKCVFGEKRVSVSDVGASSGETVVEKTALNDYYENKYGKNPKRLVNPFTEAVPKSGTLFFLDNSSRLVFGSFGCGSLPKGSNGELIGFLYPYDVEENIAGIDSSGKATSTMRDDDYELKGFFVRKYSVGTIL